MNVNDIKPIPKYIIDKIKRADKQFTPTPDGHVRFFAYLTIWKKELIKVTVAVKNKKGKWFCKQVAVHGIHTDKCYVKDMDYRYFVGMGFRVGWYEQGLQRDRRWYERNWCYADIRYFDPWGTVVNREVISKLPEYRYSAYELYTGADLLNYLRLYEQYPQTEYLLKLGLQRLAESTVILKKAGKDKKFCKWLIANKSELAHEYHYINVILQAYKTGKPLSKLQVYAKAKLKLQHDANLKPIWESFKSKDLERFFLYIAKQDTNPNTYLDYLNACNHLGLDMSLEKNRFPHDFRRWHDIRIDEYATAKAMKDAEERKELYEQFAQIAEKYLPLEHDRQNGFVVVIAKSPGELIREGEVLHHCVGRMNYDQKFVREETLIFFVRNKDSVDTPFVTVEYSLKNKKVLQCYGDSDSKPDAQVLQYVNKVWLPFANRTLKKLAA